MSYNVKSKSKSHKLVEIATPTTTSVSSTKDGQKITAYLTKIGQIVHCTIIWTGPYYSCGSQFKAFTLPSGYYPYNHDVYAYAHPVVGTQIYENTTTRYWIKTTGEVLVVSNTGAHVERQASCSWITKE